jgi:hydroxymethylglutaryl-CoA reductase (NADPH)/hydroxymethylglutaryl-CoA reductase
MNGVSAVVQATGNDTRAVEAAVRAFPTRRIANPVFGRYRIDGGREIQIPSRRASSADR